jgi:hypothetical protein
MVYHRRSQSFEIAYRRELDRAGIPQADVAVALDRSATSLSRMLNSRDDDYRCHTSDLVLMYDADGGACLRALDYVLGGCGDGYRVVPLPREEPTDLVDGVLDLEVRLGEFAGALRSARAPGSPGGPAITRMERLRLERHLQEARREIDAMLAGLSDAGAA